MPAYDIDLWDEIQIEVVQEVTDFIVELIQDSVGPDGETYGEQPMTPGSRIAQFMLDAHSGQLDALKMLNPDYHNKRVQQFLADIKNSPFVAGTYQAPAPVGTAPAPEPVPAPNIWPMQAGQVPYNTQQQWLSQQFAIPGATE